MIRGRSAAARAALCSLGAAMVLSGCALVGPPYSATHQTAARSARRGVIQQPNGMQSGVPVAPPAQAATAAPAAGSLAPPPPPQYQLGPAAEALVTSADVQERAGHYGVAAETLERAVSIEPRNPLVWIALARESLAAGNPAQAYGMARKALYLASGDPLAEASAWGQIAAALRAEGHNQAALAAEHKAALLSVQ
jgi:tetratricopeptide (TPR) repeat protein